MSVKGNFGKKLRFHRSSRAFLYSNILFTSLMQKAQGQGLEGEALKIVTLVVSIETGETEVFFTLVDNGMMLII